jgi:thioredoxin reductase (NADPH)
MKKPLILLVDDDPSVLEALETTLERPFKEICRIEGFTHPEEALGCVERWTSEERAVALAIVDQKMPGMTGVEFLKELRQHVGGGGT